MTDAHLAGFLPAACAGIGLFVVGVANLLLAGRGRTARLGATLGVCGVTLAGTATLNVPGTTAETARFLALGLVPLVLLASGRVVGGVVALVGSARRPAVRYGLLALGGVALAVWAVVSFDRADRAEAERNLAELQSMCAPPEVVPSDRERATTDRGTPVSLMVPAAPREDQDWAAAEEHTLKGGHLTGQVIRHGGATEQANCHGWVFTAGRYNISPGSVERILKENGYHPVSDPEPGDLVVYRGGPGRTIQHTGIVRYVTHGQPVLVEGKWGSLGLFLHPVEKSVYGSDYTFHRSPRDGHLLVGLDGPTPAEPPVATATE